MKVQFRSTDSEGLRLRGHVLQRLGRVLRWLRGHIARVQLRLDDVNGPEAGVDKRCEVRAELADGRVTRVAATSRHWPQAIELAMSRLREHVLAHVQGEVGSRPPAMARPRHRPAARLVSHRPAR